MEGVVVFISFFFFKQKTAYEMRISDWSSDVCSSDLSGRIGDADTVPAGGLGLVERLVGGLERRARVAIAEDVGDPAREGDLPEGFVGLAIDQPPVGERLARVVELCGGLGRGQAAKQHDEFLAAVARDMAMIVRNSCQRFGDRLDP